MHLARPPLNPRTGLDSVGKVMKSTAGGVKKYCMIEAERDLSFLVQECRMEENGVHFFHSVRLIASWIVDFISETLQSRCYL